MPSSVALRIGADPASHGPRVAQGWVSALLATTVRWGGRSTQLPRSHISLIRRISSDHPEWGEDRIALDLWLEEVLRIKGVAHPCSAAYTTTTASPPSSGLPADLSVGNTGPGRSRPSPPCWVPPSA